jgi:hypothetical protein
MRIQINFSSQNHSFAWTLVGSPFTSQNEPLSLFRRNLHGVEQHGSSQNAYFTSNCSSVALGCSCMSQTNMNRHINVDLQNGLCSVLIRAVQKSHGRTMMRYIQVGEVVANIQIIFGNAVAAVCILLRSTRRVRPIVVPHFDTVVPEADVFGRYMRHQIMIVDQSPVIRKHKIRKIREPVSEYKRGGKRGRQTNCRRWRKLRGVRTARFRDEVLQKL